ncbi:SRPBCC family protein [Sphingomonas asaccharolytica]|uniref:SRPBCC family protein n=1 Tax=Sphingomonas asaccharolytica TaxID=40681 RepID=UPI000A4BED37|nr:SRPBCC family protein [Sphingomonas asaccharolytica]
MPGRIDSASRIIHATPEAIYDAFIDPDAQARWLPPTGMTGKFDRFEPWPGGRYRLTLTFTGEHVTAGKSSADADTVEGQLVELIPGERIVQTADFESDDPAFAGTMTMTWSLRPVPGGTEVTIEAFDVPPGISAEDHAQGMASTLANLAAFLE